VLAEGLSREEWANFLRAFRAPDYNGIRCWNGHVAPGRLILRAWRQEWRVVSQRAKHIARPIAGILRTKGPDHFSKDPYCPNCLGNCRAFEPVLGAPPATKITDDVLATAHGLTAISRFYFEEDSGLGIASGSDVENLRSMFHRQNQRDQQKLLALFKRPLGKRAAPPDSCLSSSLPYPERFDIVWAVREKDMAGYVTADSIRDCLGLVHLRTAEELIVFTYPLPESLRAFVPTAIEALGGWAFWPVRGQAQRTLDYRTGEQGPREFIHSAAIPPGSMRYRSTGKLSRNWDDSQAIPATVSH